jgi:putative N6-adenine-specific DNA methylase
VADYLAVVARGIEEVAAAELRLLGAANAVSVLGGVQFSADQRCLYRALLGCRTASRILRPLREFAAGTPQMVYSQTRRVRWEDYLNPSTTFAVHATIARESAPGHPASSTASQGGRAPAARQRGSTPGWLRNSMFAAQKIKDAIVDRLRNEQGARPNVDRQHPQVLVHAHFALGRCALSLDAAGRSLHERGYRAEGGAAPMKETLAAAIIALTGWQGNCPMLDPMCGSGTLVIEAAMRALRVPPGLLRDDYLCQRWPDFDLGLWNRVRNELIAQRAEAPAVEIHAGDVDAGLVRAAQAAARRAGVESAVQFAVRRWEDWRPLGDRPGIIVTNPPYGKRLGQKGELAGFYHDLGVLLRDRFKGWTAWIFCGDLGLARNMPLVASAKFKLWNGPIVCRLMRFDL